MNKQSFSAVIIGCGFVAGGYDESPSPGVIQTHALAYQTCPEITLIAVADSNIDKAKKFTAHWHVAHAYSDAQTMLDIHKPNIVSICSPDESHTDYLKLCLESPHVKGVWCEKPLAISPEGCERLVDQFQQAGKVLLVNFQRNFTMAYRELKNDLATGKYGIIQKIVIHYTKGIMHNGSHAMDLLLDWFGMPDDNMYILAAQFDYHRNDPTVDALLYFNKTPVYFLGFSEKNYSLFEIHLYTDRTTLSLIDSGQTLRVNKVQKQSSKSGHRYLETGLDKNMGLNIAMLNALNSLIDAINGNSGMIEGNRALAGLRITHQLAQKGIKKDAS